MIRTTKLYKESLNTNYSIISTSKDKEDLNYIYSHKRDQSIDLIPMSYKTFNII